MVLSIRMNEEEEKYLKEISELLEKKAKIKCSKSQIIKVALKCYKIELLKVKD